jgi:hypothetical protein
VAGFFWWPAAHVHVPSLAQVPRTSCQIGLSLQVGSMPGSHAVQHTGLALFGEPGSPGKSDTTAQTRPGRQSACEAQGRRQTPEIWW